MPDEGRPADGQQRLDLALLRAVKHRSPEPDAFLHAGRYAHQHLVVEFEQLAQRRRSREFLLHHLADVCRIGVCFQQRCNLLAQSVRRPSEVRLQNLAHIHTRRHAQWVQHDLHRSSIGQIRHVFLGKNARDHALVAVAAGHLVANRQLALHGDIDLHQLDHARRQLIALLQLGHLLVGDLAQHFDLPRSHLLDLIDLLVDPRILVVIADALQVLGRDALDRVAVQNRALGQQALVGPLVVQVGQHFLAAQDAVQPLQALVGQNADFVAQVLFELGHVLGLDQLGALVLLLALAAEDAHVHHRALDARRAGQRSVAHIAGLFAEDGAQQLLFRRQLGLALGRDLADQNVAVLIWAPMRITPLSSRSRSACSLTLGMSRVISSGPSLVSRASISNSSMCTEV